jgi:hypothetical protein
VDFGPGPKWILDLVPSGFGPGPKWIFDLVPSGSLTWSQVDLGPVGPGPKWIWNMWDLVPSGLGTWSQVDFGPGHKWIRDQVSSACSDLVPIGLRDL